MAERKSRELTAQRRGRACESGFTRTPHDFRNAGRNAGEGRFLAFSRTSESESGAIRGSAVHATLSLKPEGTIGALAP